MSNEKIKSLLGRLHAEIDDTTVDDETRSMLLALETQIDELLDSTNERGEASSVIGSAGELEASFAAKHPLAERFIREIVDTLAKMGV